MYTPFRKTLKSLWRQFKRCTEIYPPLYYDFLRAWSPEGQENISQEAWELFEKANALDEEEGWEQWDGDPEAGFYGRFYGDPAGLAEFMQLAESAYLAVSEMDSTLVQGRGYCGWLDVLYDIAFVYPTPLLRCDLTQWGFDDTGTEEEFVERAAKWSKVSRKQPSYPKHPCRWSLNHSLFISSMAAIQLTLEPDSALVVAQLDDFPLKIDRNIGVVSDENHSPQALVAKQPSPQGAQDTTPATGATYVFRRPGTLWHLCCTEGEYREDDKFKHEVGIEHYARILAAAPMAVKCLDLAPPKPDSWDSKGSLVKREHYGRSHEDDSAAPGPGKDDSYDRTEDEDYMREMRAKLSALEDQLSAAEATENKERIDEVTHAIKQLNEQKRKDVFRGRPRRLGSPEPEEQARSAIRKALWTCRGNLCRGGFPRLAAHLEKYVRFSGKGYEYRGGIQWQLY
jgi:hypothetical protein